MGQPSRYDLASKTGGVGSVCAPKSKVVVAGSFIAFNSSNSGMFCVVELKTDASGSISSKSRLVCDVASKIDGVGSVWDVA